MDLHYTGWCQHYYPDAVTFLLPFPGRPVCFSTKKVISTRFSGSSLHRVVSALLPWCSHLSLGDLCFSTKNVVYTRYSGSPLHRAVPALLPWCSHLSSAFSWATCVFFYQKCNLYPVQWLHWTGYSGWEVPRIGYGECFGTDCKGLPDIVDRVTGALPDGVIVRLENRTRYSRSWMVNSLITQLSWSESVPSIVVPPKLHTRKQRGGSAPGIV